MMYEYKSGRPGPSQIATIFALLSVGLIGHYACVETLAKVPLDGWSVIPGRTDHSRNLLAEYITRILDPRRQVPLEFGPVPQRRTLDASNFTAPQRAEGLGHVLLIDDSWVSGAWAQSGAAALRQAGVEEVSVMTIARVLDPTFGNVGAFVQKYRTKDFDTTLCPWTGHQCPPQSSNQHSPS